MRTRTDVHTYTRTYTHTHIYVYIYMSFIHNYQDLEATKISFSRGIEDKTCMQMCQKEIRCHVTEGHGRLLRQCQEDSEKRMISTM